MVFYTLGVMPAEPGYTAARIAPRLGNLEWIKGAMPTPFGLIQVEATPTEVTVESPVPFSIDMEDRPIQQFSAGRHSL
jgi:hypothetical protein